MNQDAFCILRLLADGEYHSGDSLARYLQCSSSKISDSLRCVDSLGVEITKLRGRGYRWHNPILWLNSDLIVKNLSIYQDCFNIKILDSIDSTNNFLLRNFEDSREIGNCIPVIASELQTDGRGRQGRKWCTGLGDSLTFSLRWDFMQGASALSGLSLVIGIAVVRVLKSFSINNVSLKWPNDILVDHHKLGGILIELRGEILGPSSVFIGIGINFRLSEIVKSYIQQKVTDISVITGEYMNRNLVLGALLLELRDTLINFEKYGFTHFKKEWIRYHAYEGKLICLTLPDNSVIEGTVDGVNDDGSLCLLSPMGRISYTVGDISLRLK